MAGRDNAPSSPSRSALSMDWTSHNTLADTLRHPAASGHRIHIHGGSLCKPAHWRLVSRAPPKPNCCYVKQNIEFPWFLSCKLDKQDSMSKTLVP